MGDSSGELNRQKLMNTTCSVGKVAGLEASQQQTSPNTCGRYISPELRKQLLFARGETYIIFH